LASFASTFGAVTKWSKMSQNMSFGPMDWIGCVRCQKFRRDFVKRTCALRALVRPDLHRLSCSNETVRNGPKHEFWVQWSGSGAFIAKNFNTTSFSELVR
jgi:hypothetical protein